MLINTKNMRDQFWETSLEKIRVCCLLDRALYIGLRSLISFAIEDAIGESIWDNVENNRATGDLC